MAIDSERIKVRTALSILGFSRNGYTEADSENNYEEVWRHEKLGTIVIDWGSNIDWSDMLELHGI